jgi:hypothetical protein
MNNEGKLTDESIKIGAGDEHGHGNDGHNHGAGAMDFERFRKGIHSKEGCKIYGYMLLNKVPGNFHISAHAFGEALTRAF